MNLIITLLGLPVAALLLTGDDQVQRLHGGLIDAVEDVLGDRSVSVSGHRPIVTTVQRHDRTNRSEP